MKLFDIVKLTQQEINMLILIIVSFLLFYVGCKLINRRELNIEYNEGSFKHNREPFIVQENNDEFIKKVEHFEF